MKEKFGTLIVALAVATFALAAITQRPLNPNTGKSAGVGYGDTLPTDPHGGELFVDIDASSTSGPQLRMYDSVNGTWTDVGPVVGDAGTIDLTDDYTWTGTHDFTGGTVTGDNTLTVGTLNRIPKFAAADLADSLLSDDGTDISLASGDLALASASELRWSTDAKLVRDAAQVIALRNSTNAQEIRVYNTDDGAGNTEYAQLGFIAQGNTFQINTAAAGTGTVRSLRLKVTAGQVYSFDNAQLMPVATEVSLGRSDNLWKDVMLGEYIRWMADLTTDTAPTDDTTIKRLSIQRLAAAPTNAAYIQFSNWPGSAATELYLVLEEGS